MRGARAQAIVRDMLTAIAIIWFLIWVFVVVDIVRRPVFTTLKKVAWALIVLIFPILGVIAYLIVRPPDSADRYGKASDSEPEERMRGSHPV